MVGIPRAVWPHGCGPKRTPARDRVALIELRDRCLRSGVERRGGPEGKSLMRQAGEATAPGKRDVLSKVRMPTRLAARVSSTIGKALSRFSLFQRFVVLSLVILVVGAYVIGSYVSDEIRDRGSK